MVQVKIMNRSLRSLSNPMSISSPRQSFIQEISQPAAAIDLTAAALYFAQAFYPQLQPQLYFKTLEQMSLDLKSRLPEPRYPLKVIQTINAYFYGDLGFAGNKAAYYDPRNSYLNQVIDRRLGIPITLALVYLDLARRIDFPMVGVGMPGHFLLRPEVDDMAVYVDVFNQGNVLFEQDCRDTFVQIYGLTALWQPDFLKTITPKLFLGRVLTNVKMIYLQQQTWSALLMVCDYLLLLFPDNIYECRDRGLAHYQLGHVEDARQDLTHYLDQCPTAEDASQIQQLLAQME